MSVALPQSSSPLRQERSPASGLVFQGTLAELSNGIRVY